MRLAILSGNDQRGRQLAQQALTIGYDVTLLVSSPKSVTIRSDRLTVVRGKLQDQAAIQKTLRKADAVIGILDGAGVHGIAIAECVTYHMHQLGLRRLLLALDHSLHAKDTTHTLWQQVVSFFFPPKTVYTTLMASQLEWTALCNVPADTISEEKLDVYIHRCTSQADVSRFMLSQLTDTTYLQKSVGLVV